MLQMELCPECKKQFTRKTDVEDHLRSVHDKAKFFCAAQDCEKSEAQGWKGYTRKDKVKAHEREKH